MDRRNPSQKKTQPRTSYLNSALRWLRLKNYQYEVSSSLYMLTPTEKLIFNFILIVLISLLLTAAYFYLPNHVSLILSRVWYYAMGERGAHATTNAKLSMSQAASAAAKTIESVVGQRHEL